MQFEKLDDLKRHAKWGYDFYKEEKHRYISHAMKPSPEYFIRVLKYSNGRFLTLASLANEEEFLKKPKILQALKMGPFEGHRDTLELSMNETLQKIGNAIERALKV